MQKIVIDGDVTSPKLQTVSNKYIDLMNPSVDDIDIEDIAHALSQLCRFGGHTNRFYSVGQHSVLVAESLPEEYQLYGLLHDASEAYIVDIPRPLKQYLPEYKKIESKIMRVICEKFGLDQEMPPEVKEADNLILDYELYYLMPDQPQVPYDELFKCIDYPWDEVVTFNNFMDLFDDLTS